MQTIQTLIEQCVKWAQQILLLLVKKNRTNQCKSIHREHECPSSSQIVDSPLSQRIPFVQCKLKIQTEYQQTITEIQTRRKTVSRLSEASLPPSSIQSDYPVVD